MKEPSRPAPAGERELGQLLAHASPRAQPGDWVFVVTGPAALASLAPIGTFVEPEGLTAICPRERADACGLGYDGVFRQITLTIHSSLHAVGFLAALSRALADAGIPCNVVSAAHHDHLFVPADCLDEALRALHTVSRG